VNEAVIRFVANYSLLLASIRLDMKLGCPWLVPASGLDQGLGKKWVSCLSIMPLHPGLVVQVFQVFQVFQVPRFSPLILEIAHLQTRFMAGQTNKA
jgi:hypothetical protein